MGRHSAPSDDDTTAAALIVDAHPLPFRAGRAEVDDAAAGVAEAPIAVPAVAAPVEAVPAVEAPVEAVPAADGVKSSEPVPKPTDLALLRTDSGLRARSLASVVAPFLIYTLVLLIISRTDVYLIWIWIPMVTAGVLVGNFLDLAHKKASVPLSTEPTSNGDSAPSE